MIRIVSLTVTTSTMEQPQLQAQVVQPSLRTCLEHELKYPANSKRALELTKSVGYFIAKDLMPLSVVEVRGFAICLKNLSHDISLQAEKR